MMRRFLSTLGGILLLLLSAMVAYAALTGGESLLLDLEGVIRAVIASPQPVDMPVPPCAYESSPGPCYWDAEIRNNGMGHSFTVDHLNRVTYWD